ncbi:MAG: hypothetical protein ACR2QM_16900 [Longimicrobiales bacterium]
MKTGKRIIPLAALALVAYGCAEQPPPSVTEVEVLDGTSAAAVGTISSLQDGNNNGNAAFLWLQPVSDGVPTGPLLTGLSPEVEICDRDGVCSRTAADEEDDHYHADLKSGIDGKPINGSPYEIRVYGFGDFLLGSFDVALTNNGNIPLKFWIGDGFDAEAAEECLDADRCNLGGIVGDEGGTVVVASPLGGTGAIAAAVFPEGWSPGGIDRTVTIDCRDDFPSELADDGTGPLNTGLTQIPWYCDFSLDPALEPGEMFLEDVVVEVCETVDMDHATVVLGKTDNPGGDFELLPFVEPENLGDCFADYPGGDLGEISGANGFWGDVSRRLAAVFEVIGPEPLRANMLRDGGAGGSVRGFSLINPTIPAIIEVEVEGDEGGLEVTLSLDGDVVATEETDDDGHVHFEGLAEGDYEVGIEDSEVDYEGGPVQSVEVDNSGPFEVVFVPEEGEEAPSGFGVADIDGVLDEYEWDQAVTFEVFSGSPLSGTLHVMNDYANLYFALEVDDSDLDAYFEIRFDTDDNPEFGSDLEDLWGLGPCFEGCETDDGGHIGEGGWGYSVEEDVNQVDGAVTFGTGSVYELGHPLSTSDFGLGEFLDLTTQLGDVIGFCAIYTNPELEGSGVSGAYPEGCESDQNLYQRLEIFADIPG